jgi:hypothetical protein
MKNELLVQPPFIESALSILEKSGQSPAFSLTVDEQLTLQKYAIYCVNQSNQLGEPVTPHYYSQTQTADILHCSLPTIIDYRKKGWLKGRRVGAKILYTQADIDEAVKTIAVSKYKRV